MQCPNHIGDNYSQPERQPIAQHPEDEHVSQLAHRKNALLSSGALPWASLQCKCLDTERMKRNCPQCKPRECHGDANRYRKDEITHDRILFPIAQELQLPVAIRPIALKFRLLSFSSHLKCSKLIGR